MVQYRQRRGARRLSRYHHTTERSKNNGNPIFMQPAGLQALYNRGDAQRVSDREPVCGKRSGGGVQPCGPNGDAGVHAHYRDGAHRQGHRHLAQLRHAVFSGAPGDRHLQHRRRGQHHGGRSKVRAGLQGLPVHHAGDEGSAVRQRRRGESREVLHGVGPGTPGV